MFNHRRRSGSLLKVGTAALALSMLLLGGLSAAGPQIVNADPPEGGGNGTKEIGERMRKANAPFRLRDEHGASIKSLGGDKPTRVGTVKYWLALDDTQGFYLKKYQLQAQSEGAEIWVALALEFPRGDCRNDRIRTVVTDEQTNYLLEQFDENILPTDKAWFGDPVTRDGSNAVLPLLPPNISKGSNTYFDPNGRDVVLVDNVRDDNYYDTDNANSFPYIAGFFTSAMSFYHDRNVITIDAFDWLHRTGENPPHDPSTDPCTSASARPFLYEAVIAHEYQHLIHADIDPDEVTWVNEGMSDLAEILTGYSDPSKHVDEKGADSHTLNFQGWAQVFHADWNPIPRPNAGPENSLTAWEDQGPLEILGDYGHAYYFMTYLLNQGYGQSFFTSWAANTLNGIEGLDDTLGLAGSLDTFASLFADVEVSVLVDAFLDGSAAISGEVADDLANDDANSTIHFTGDAYDTPGAPPWGSDYVPLGPGPLTSVAFNGDEEFVFPGGPQWIVDGNGYFAVIDTSDPDTTYASNMDVSITHEVTIGATSTLTFNHYYDTETGWDFGFVQISDDGGATWTSLACTGTTSVHDPGAIAPIVANMPGYTGTAGSAAAPLAASCDLTGYDGAVIIAFRFMSDPAVEQTGWFVKDVQIDGADVGPPGDLTGWNNQKFYDPAVLDFTLRLVGLSGDVDGFGHVTDATAVVVVDIPLNGDNEGAATAEQLTALAGADEVVAIVSGVPESEESGIYAPYSLLVDGIEAADGVAAVDPW